MCDTNLNLLRGKIDRCGNKIIWPQRQQEYMCVSAKDTLLQTAKKIDNVVGVPSSTQTEKMGSASVSQNPNVIGWNQMSDRINPHEQTVVIAKTKNRPGSMSPGGIGVDVKHGSYARRLAKLKGTCCV